jgi:hypothetical protein
MVKHELGLQCGYIGFTGHTEDTAQSTDYRFQNARQENYAEVDDGGQTQRPGRIHGNTPVNHIGLTVSGFRDA